MSSFLVTDYTEEYWRI